jgi:hypothetical protein
MKRPLSIVLSAAVFTSVIAGALTLSTLKLMQPKTGSTAAAPPKDLVSASAKASPAMVGTDHPVAVNSPLRSASGPRLSDRAFLDKRESRSASPKSNAPNLPATPIPEASALVENASRHQPASPSTNTSRHEAETEADNASSREADSPAEIVRENAEQSRERAENLRARVEELYQAHQISETAYKQGQAEYQHALAKYEDQIAKLRGPTSGTGGTND